MFSVPSSAHLLSFLLAALGPGRLHINLRIGLNQYSRWWIESIFQVLDWTNISGIGLNQYSRYWIESIFQVLNWINIRGIGLNQYFRYWIEPIFQVLDWTNIRGIGLNQYSRYWIGSIFEVLHWIMKIKRLNWTKNFIYDWIECLLHY